MKKTIAVLLMVGIVLCMNACGAAETTQSTGTTSNATQTQVSESSTQTTSSVATSNDTQTQATESGTQDKEELSVFERFENALQNQGISFDSTQMVADLIGAKQGVKYSIGDGKIELYLFDEESEKYAAALSSQKLTLEGFGDFDAHVASGVAMLIDGLDESTYTAIFEEITK